jgi:hypothetical protein
MQAGLLTAADKLFRKPTDGKYHVKPAKGLATITTMKFTVARVVNTNTYIS